MKHMRITSKLASMAPLACSIAMGIGVWASPAGAETVGGGILESGAWVSQGSKILSRGRQASARLQDDGRLCVYKSGSPVWCSEDRPHRPGNYYVIMQEDSRLCINQGTGPREDGGQQGSEVWCSENAPLATDNYFLKVDDSGSLGIFVAGGSDGSRGTASIHKLHAQPQQFRPSQPLPPTPAAQPQPTPAPQPQAQPKPQRPQDDRPIGHKGNKFID